MGQKQVQITIKGLLNTSMATKEEVTEYIDYQFERGGNDYNVEYWENPMPHSTGNRLGLIQSWMSPEVAGILQKLVGDAIMVSRLAKNRSNSNK